MAVSTILLVRIGRYVIIKFTNTDHIVVTVITGISQKIDVVISAGAEGTWRMAGITVLAADGHVFIERRR